MLRSLVMSFVIMLLSWGTAQASTDGDYLEANRLFTASRFQQAIPLYEQLLLSPPPGVPVSDIQIRIADSWLRVGSFQKALDTYRAAIKDQKESSRPETQYWIGFCCFLLGRDAEAVTEFLKIPELYPSSGMWVGTAYYWAGRAAQRMGKAEQAREYYNRAGGNGRSTQGRFALEKADQVKPMKENAGKQHESMRAE